MTATTLSLRLSEIVCQVSYPLNSEKASPPGTRTAYLPGPESWADGTRPPSVDSQSAASPPISTFLRCMEFLLACGVVPCGNDCCTSSDDDHCGRRSDRNPARGRPRRGRSRPPPGRKSSLRTSRC